MPFVRTPVLNVAYEERNPGGSDPLLFLHGFPDDARTWDGVLAHPALAGRRAIVPWTRGYGGTTFVPGVAPTAQAAALARDAIELLDALGIERCTLVGHDWGARAGYAAAILAPERFERLVAIATAYGTVGASAAMTYEQAAAYWYQWLFATPRGEAALRDDRRELGRTLWRMWSPAWRFDDAAFARTADAWDTPAFADVVLHSYRHRWGFAPGEARYADDEARLAETPPVTIPTVVIAGGDDRVTLPYATEGKEAHFTSSYARLVVPEAGHFVQRESPDAVARAIAGA